MTNDDGASRPGDAADLPPGTTLPPSAGVDAAGTGLPLTPADAHRRRRSLLRHTNFRHLFFGDAGGQLAAQLTMFALPVYAVTHLHATEWQMGVLDAANFAAFLLIGLPAGAWVDRMRKRRVLIVADLIRAGIVAVVVAAALTDNASMPLLYAAALVFSACTVFFDVAYQSYLPGLVGLDNLVEGNAKLQAVHTTAGIVGPAGGGALLRVVTAPFVLAVSVVGYLVSAFWISRIQQVEELPDRADRRPLRTEIAEGLGFVVRQPLLRRIVACTAGGNFANAVGGAVTAIFILRTLGVSEATFGLVVSAGAAGGLLGALTAERLARLVGEGRTIPIAALLIAPAYALVPLTPYLPLPPAVPLATSMFFFGVAVVVYNVAQVSFRQRICPRRLLGRMNASVRFIVWGIVPVGALVGGWIGFQLGAAAALWTAAAGMLLAALPVVASPLLTMRDLPRPPTEAP